MLIALCSYNSELALCIFRYKGKPTDTLTTLRHAKFMQMLATCRSIEPRELPPTERAAYFHALRVHLQVPQWKYLDLQCLDPLQWGWKLEKGHLVPIKTDLDAAPEFLLNCIRCNCKTTSKNTCGTLICSCRKNGLSCVASCSDCRGESCNNISEATPLLEDDVLFTFFYGSCWLIRNTQITRVRNLIIWYFSTSTKNPD